MCTTYDITMQSWFIHACESKKRLLKFQASKVSYVSDLLSLPAEEIVRRLDLSGFVTFGDVTEDGIEDINVNVTFHRLVLDRQEWWD
ncbi:MAG: hypothetical protein KAR05_02640 [Candidatus Omnitrophica bacterium]|nr:hypothetical protein [Candidatus Omnitrophota bacterium]